METEEVKESAEKKETTLDLLDQAEGKNNKYNLNKKLQQQILI